MNRNGNNAPETTLWTGKRPDAVQSGSSHPRHSGLKQEFLLCLHWRTMTLEGRRLIPPSYPCTRVLGVYLNLGLLDMTKAFAGNHWALARDGGHAHLQMEWRDLQITHVLGSQCPVLPTEQLGKTFNLGGYGGSLGYSCPKHYDLFWFFSLLPLEFSVLVASHAWLMCISWVLGLP